ncbi:hypothetical protein PL2TA16_02491 [Pseudoalteromonas luteoviolacea 2ta16]|uniref:Uncharacterized protein n=1 Tax=Pseudoalteromonas luteoviolacea (strain 2ta16) TaxID=1353533 RepID=V4I1J1_PSEL2|nr:hypothetical protein PL2TA16_02491 [Pseudoalteromonas luteoviolacea 2ta16]
MVQTSRQPKYSVTIISFLRRCFWLVVAAGLFVLPISHIDMLHIICNYDPATQPTCTSHAFLHTLKVLEWLE